MVGDGHWIVVGAPLELGKDAVAAFGTKLPDRIRENLAIIHRHASLSDPRPPCRTMRVVIVTTRHLLGGCAQAAQDGAPTRPSKRKKAGISRPPIRLD